MVDRSAASPAASVLLGRAGIAAPYPVLVVDQSGVVVETNPAAGELFPLAVAGGQLIDAVPEWLSLAHHRLADHRLADHGLAHPSLGGPGPAPAVDDGPDAPVSVAAQGLVGNRSFEAHPSQHNDTVAWWLVEDTDRRLAERALRTERERSAFLAEASNALLVSLNVERCMRVTVQLAVEHLADAVALVAPSVGHRHPVSYGITGGVFSQAQLTVDPAEVPGLAEALQGFPPVPSRWIDPATLPEWAVPSEFRGSVGSVVVTPLPGHGVPAGALILLRQADQTAFSEGEEVFARLFAARAGAALSAARMYAEKARITDTLTRSLLPPTLGEIHGVDFAGGYLAAQTGERLGGDFYDVHPGPDPDAESLAVLGDVCGHGLEAAVLAGKIRTTLQALLPMIEDHERLLNLLNGALLNVHDTRFATLVLASVRRTPAGARLRVTSAGHPPALIARADGSVEECASRGTLVGALPSVTASTVEIDLEPGEICLLYTDGITEAKGGPLGDELFGEGRLRTVLAECAGLPAEAVVERVHMLASQWAGPARRDDMALVAITPTRLNHLSAVGGHTRGRYTR